MLLHALLLPSLVYAACLITVYCLLFTYLCPLPALSDSLLPSFLICGVYPITYCLLSPFRVVLSCHSLTVLSSCPLARVAWVLPPHMLVSSHSTSYFVLFCVCVFVLSICYLLCLMLVFCCFCLTRSLLRTVCVLSMSYALHMFVFRFCPAFLQAFLCHLCHLLLPLSLRLQVTA